MDAEHSKDSGKRFQLIRAIKGQECPRLLPFMLKKPDLDAALGVFGVRGLSATQAVEKLNELWSVSTSAIQAAKRLIASSPVKPGIRLLELRRF